MGEPLRICLFLSSSHIGGTERMALEFIRHCDRSRVTPHVLVKLRGGPLPEMVEELGVPCEVLQTPGDLDKRPLWVFESRVMAEFLKAHRIELIHNFGLRAELTSRPHVRHLGVKKIVSGIRDTDPWRRFYHVWLDRLTSGWVDLYIANSHVAAEVSLKRERRPPEKMRVIHNGVPLPTAMDRTAARKLFSISPDAGPVVAHVANLVPGKKGHDVLFEAIVGLRGRFPGLRVICAGRDASGGRIPALAEKLGLGEVVTFTGYCDKARELFQAADLAVLPSRFESFPTSIVEAMAAGCPVVASDVGGISEVIRDGENGSLVSPEDHAVLGEAISRLLGDRERLRDLGKAARATIEKDFTVETMCRRIEEAYLSLFPGRS
ncbi:MAG: glycosyltransferase family 4 protein [Candidatus Sumerlaeia bacterium]|nr:glycosyltransferase family 4 protein [Candidatus Sumerlaeia bacterium]